MKLSEFKSLIKEEVDLALFEHQLTEGKISDFLSKIKLAAMKAAKDNYSDAIAHIDVDKLKAEPMSISKLDKVQRELESQSQQISEGFVDKLKSFARKGFAIGAIGSVISGATVAVSAMNYLDYSFTKWYYTTIQGMAKPEVMKAMNDIYGAKVEESSIWFTFGMYVFSVFFVIALLSYASIRINKQK